MNKDKRNNYINWDTYFMGLARICALRSKDPSTQVGAVIRGLENKVIGLGYNGMPLGKDEVFPWGKSGESNETKYKYVIHAEINAIFQSDFQLLKDSIIYITLYPCSNCAKIMVKAGIKEVVYLEDKYKDSKDGIIANEILKKLKIKQRHIKNNQLEISPLFK